jgi:hypothetical protein
MAPVNFYLLLGISFVFCVPFVRAVLNTTVDDINGTTIQFGSGTTGRWIPQNLKNLNEKPDGEGYLAVCYDTTLSSAKGDATASFSFTGNPTFLSDANPLLISTARPSNAGTAVYLRSLIYQAGDLMNVTLDGHLYPPVNLSSSTQTISTIVFSQQNLSNSAHVLVVQKHDPDSNLYVNVDAITFVFPRLT